MLTVADYSQRSLVRSTEDYYLSTLALRLLTANSRLPTAPLAADALTRHLLGSKPGNRTNGNVCKRGCIKLHSHDTQVGVLLKRLNAGSHK